MSSGYVARLRFYGSVIDDQGNPALPGVMKPYGSCTGYEALPKLPSTTGR